MTIGVWQSEQCICMPGILDQMAVQVIKKDSPLLQKSMMANCELSRGSIMKRRAADSVENSSREDDQMLYQCMLWCQGVSNGP